MKKASNPKKSKPRKLETLSPILENAGSESVRYSYILGSTFGLKKITYSVVGDFAVFEGDIILGTVKQMERMKKTIEHPDPNIEEACAIIAQNRWPNGIIPFEIDANMPDQQRVTDAISHLQTNTNLRIIARTNETDFVHFQGGSGCSSYVGKRGGRQDITLGPGCDWPRAVHETCHAAGLWHEQSREDRDDFVIIHWDNIQSLFSHNFNQHISDGDDIGPYDYDSLMHYGRRDFAIDPTKDTITPTPNSSRAIGQRTGLSTGDIIAINALYPRKATLKDTSTDGPALIMRKEQILLGWTGVGNLRLNFMRSMDGLHFANKVTLSELSSKALALNVFKGKFVVAWTGIVNNKLNIMQSSDGINWANKVTLHETSLSSPALAVFGNKIVIAWRGVGNNKINVMLSTNGIDWQNKKTLSDTTTSGPSLACLGDHILLSWRGVGNNKLNVMRSNNGTSYLNKVTLNETTLSKPQLHVRNNLAFLTWQGVGNKFLNILSSPDGLNWRNKFVSKETCIGGPVLATLGNNLVWGWTGTNVAHNLNTLLFNWV